MRSCQRSYGHCHPNPVTVDFELAAAVGPIGSSADAAEWQPAELLGSKQVERVEANDTIAITLPGFDLESILLSYWDAQEWPFQLRVSAEMACSECPTRQSATHSWTMTPGD